MKLYIGNLSYETTDADLQAAFAAHGEVRSAQVVTDRETGRSRGFGFVEMDDRGQAEAAISALNGSQLRGRTLIVNEARPREDRPRSGGGYGGGSRGGYGGGRGGSFGGGYSGNRRF
ncbi:RNA-binding protein [Tepidiforma flava]|uniref:RNA-binding protein n=1 Tax=Tepidiforma flava TaxID=3004094 RepID=A0ABY7MAS2_9CHLR|nr:RNA-binding protein [Tepidiforma flava]WBL37180.1 RNA-binding protein [Tepidiforma flava]